MLGNASQGLTASSGLRTTVNRLSVDPTSVKKTSVGETALIRPLGCELSLLFQMPPDFAGRKGNVAEVSTDGIPSEVDRRPACAIHGENDFRVTSWGRILRKAWIDEVPMLWNLLKGDLKLVGVRPLSPHYLSLYPEDVTELRKGVRPGLIPPYYADLPVGFDAIVDSERQYLLKYGQHPLRTDLSYLRRALWNIIVRRKRSS